MALSLQRNRHLSIASKEMIKSDARSTDSTYHTTHDTHAQHGNKGGQHQR